MNKVITSPATNIPAHEKSHVRGWSLGWAELLEADISNRCDDDIMQYDLYNGCKVLRIIILIFENWI